MTRIRISGPARRDIARILRRSRGEFGLEAADRYRTLLDRALNDLAEDSSRPGVRNIFDVKQHYLAYQVKMSVGRAPKPTVRHPRHVIAFRLESAREIFVARVFHERQLLTQHLNDGDS